MRHLILLVLCLLSIVPHLMAQCCCGGIGVQVTLPFPAMREGQPTCIVSPEKPLYGSYTTVRDSTIELDLSTGCGLDEHTWVIRQRSGGMEMRIRLLHMGGDINYPTIRVPFSSGEYLFDMRHIARCMADQPLDPQRRGAMAPGDPEPIDTIGCNGGLMAVQRAPWSGGWFQPLDLQRFFWTPNMDFPAPTEVASPSYPGGEVRFQQQLRIHFSKALIERIGARLTITGHAMVEENGYIHKVHLNGSAYPELDAELERVVRLSQRWTPASVLDIAVTANKPVYRYIRQSVPISFTVDPDLIWSRIPDASMDITPEVLGPTDSIWITLKWIGGSCGRYESSTQVLPKDPDAEVTDIVLVFDRSRTVVCCDIKPQFYTHVMAPLARGRYRLHQQNIDPGRSDARGPHWYVVREFEVK